MSEQLQRILCRPKLGQLNDIEITFFGSRDERRSLSESPGKLAELERHLNDAAQTWMRTEVKPE